MKIGVESIHKIVDQYVQKWHDMMPDKTKKKKDMPVIAISRQPGSGGRIIGKMLADKFGLDLFDRDIIHEMAKNPHISTTVIETLDQEALLSLDEWASSFIYKKNLTPDRFLRDLVKIIGTIGKHGQAVIVGSGANLILQPEVCFRVRIIAPLEIRARHIARAFSVTTQEAERRAIKTESRREAFINKYFNIDIADPINYDLVINMETLSLDAAVNTICVAIGKKI
jgi:cytidylate kinase